MKHQSGKHKITVFVEAWYVCHDIEMSFNDIEKYIIRLDGSTPQNLISLINALEPQPSYLLINTDTFGDIDQAVDILIKLRRQKPLVSLIILSSHFLVDDLDDNRISICDASLRLPISRRRLLTALEFARATNKKWNVRVAQTI